MNYFLKNPQRGKNQLATLDFPLAEVRPVLVVAVTSSVEKEGRCPWNVHSKSITFWIRNQEIFLILRQGRSWWIYLIKNVIYIFSLFADHGRLIEPIKIITCFGEKQTINKAVISVKLLRHTFVLSRTKVKLELMHNRRLKWRVKIHFKNPIFSSFQAYAFKSSLIFDTKSCFRIFAVFRLIRTEGSFQQLPNCTYYRERFPIGC